MENELESPQAGAAGHLVCSEPGSRGDSVGGSFGPFVTPKRSARCRIPALLLSVSLPLLATWVQRRGRVAQVAAAAPGPPEWSPRRLRTRRPGGGAPAPAGASSPGARLRLGVRASSDRTKKRKEISTRLPARAARQTESALHPLFGGKGGGRGRGGCRRG